METVGMVSFCLQTACVHRSSPELFKPRQSGFRLLSFVRLVFTTLSIDLSSALIIRVVFSIDSFLPPFCSSKCLPGKAKNTFVIMTIFKIIT